MCHFKSEDTKERTHTHSVFGRALADAFQRGTFPQPAAPEDVAPAANGSVARPQAAGSPHGENIVIGHCDGDCDGDSHCAAYEEPTPQLL